MSMFTTPGNIGIVQDNEMKAYIRYNLQVVNMEEFSSKFGRNNVVNVANNVLNISYSYPYNSDIKYLVGKGNSLQKTI